MHTYLVSYWDYRPTGRFFVPFAWEPDSMVLEMEHPFSTDQDRLDLKARIAGLICKDTYPPMGRGRTIDNGWVELFQTLEEVTQDIRIANVQHLHSRP